MTQDDRGTERSGDEQGLQENSGLQDEKAKDGKDTAAALQDGALETGSAPQQGQAP